MRDVVFKLISCVCFTSAEWSYVVKIFLYFPYNEDLY